MTKQKEKSKSGPKPDSLRIEGNWKDAVKQALKKERPAGGWPEEEKKKKKD